MARTPVARGRVGQAEAARLGSDVLSREDAWQWCVRRERRLRLAAARMGLADQAEDLVHDTFVEVMKTGLLYRVGFDALLDTVLWRRCVAALRRQARQERLCRDGRLVPGDEDDHADRVVDRLYAVWLLGHCDRLDENDLHVLGLAADRLAYDEIAARTGLSARAVGDALRSVRRKARRQIRHATRRAAGREGRRMTE
jgi:DNA-directed RNA polymerase specialized sigma24 family protein